MNIKVTFTSEPTFIHVRKDCGKSGKSKSTRVSRNLKKRCLQWKSFKTLKNVYNYRRMKFIICARKVKAP